MAHAPLGRDRIHLLDHRLDLAQRDQSVLAGDLGRDHARREEHAGARAAEGLDHRAVVELPHHARMHVAALEPAQQALVDREILARQQQRRIVQAGRERLVEAGRQGFGAEGRHRALAQQVVVGAHAEVARDRAVGDDQVEPMHRQVGDQAVEAPFAADQLDGFFELERRLHQVEGDQLGDRVGAADAVGGGGEGVVAHQLEQLVARIEDLFGIAHDAAPGVGQFELAPDPAKQLDAQAVGEFGQLARDRVRGQVQLLGRLRDAAGLGHHPKVAQVLVVECRHGPLA